MSFNSKEGEIEKKYGIKEGNYMKFEEGENKVRLVSDCQDFGNHFDTQLKRSFICTGKETCAYCQKGEKSKARFYVWVIDRRDNVVKLAEFGYMIFEEIKKLAASDDYGFDKVPAYDIDINRKGKGLDTKYSVLAARKDSPLANIEEAGIEKDDSAEVIKEKTEKNTKAMNESIKETCKDLKVMIQEKKDKLIKGEGAGEEINVNQVVQKKAEPVKQTDEKIVLAENK